MGPLRLLLSNRMQLKIMRRRDVPKDKASRRRYMRDELRP